MHLRKYSTNLFTTNRYIIYGFVQSQVVIHVQLCPAGLHLINVYGEGGHNTKKIISSPASLQAQLENPCKVSINSLNHMNIGFLSNIKN